ncbi:hypothetical protein FRC17_000670 [Serendipita sp. 399]|nr:hypothetical protein FRC17_000670 [Serendipita sp. 399]
MKSYALDARLIKGRIMLVDGSVDLRTGKIFNHSSTSALVAASAPTAPAPTPASASTTTATTTTTTATAASGSAANNNNGNGAGATTAPTASSGTGAAVSSQQNLPVALLPIDRMEEHVRSVLEEVGKESELMADGVYPVNYGSAIICGRAGAPKLMKLLHEKILGGL